MLDRQRRLRARRDFARVYAARAGLGGRLLIVHATPNPDGQVRVGFSVSARVGGAVVRNRVKRRLRAAARAELVAANPGAAALDGLDLVVVARPEAAAASYPDLAAELRRLLARTAARRRQGVAAPVAQPGPRLDR